MLRTRWARFRNGLLELLLLVGLALPLGLGWAGFTPPAHALETGELNMASPDRCLPLDEAEVIGFFERWNQALASGDPNQVVQLYAEHALLLPTLSAELRETPEGIRDYFTAFLARHPSGEVTHRLIRLGCNEAVDAGTYRFALHDPEASVEARYTFVYEPEGGSWRIVHHHSSLQPG